MVNKNAIKQWLSPLMMLFIIHTLQKLNRCMEPHKNIYRHSILITWQTKTCTAETITLLLTYLLCLSRKGCSAREITKANHGVWNDKHITANYTYILHVHCMIFLLTYTTIHLWTYSKPASAYLSPTSLYHVPHIKVAIHQLWSTRMQLNSNFPRSSLFSLFTHFKCWIIGWNHSKTYRTDTVS